MRLLQTGALNRYMGSCTGEYFIYSSAEQSPLYVFIIGGGGTDYVWIDASSLSASDLDDDLDDYTATVNASLVSNGASSSTALPVYVIVDSDYSGTFADDLGATAGRVVLTSTGETALTGTKPSNR